MQDDDAEVDATEEYLEYCIRFMFHRPYLLFYIVVLYITDDTNLQNVTGESDNTTLNGTPSKSKDVTKDKNTEPVKKRCPTTDAASSNRKDTRKRVGVQLQEAREQFATIAQTSSTALQVYSIPIYVYEK